MTPIRARGVLFDLDGTLIDSTPAVVRCWSRILIELGLPTDIVPSLHGIPASQSLRKLLPDASEDEIEHWYRKIERYEIEDTEGIVFLDGAAELHNTLRERGIPFLVVTSCTRELARARAQAVGLTLPQNSVFFDDVERGKPFPDPYLVGLSRLRLSADDVIAVEDAPAGVESARAAGLRVVGLTTTHTRDELHLAEPVIDSLRELEILAH